VPEPYPDPELRKAGVGRGPRCPGTGAEPSGCPPHQGRVTDRIGCGEYEQAPGSGRGERELFAGSSPRRCQATAARQAVRSPARVPLLSRLVAVQAAPAGCRASRPRSGHGPACRSARSVARRTAPAHRPPATPRHRALASRLDHRPGHACRIRDRPIRSPGGGRRTSAPEQRRDRPTTGHRPGTAAAPFPRPGQACPARPGR
jgi:hypothetical protein